MQRAERLGIKVSDESLNQALTDVAARNQIQFSDLPSALESRASTTAAIARTCAGR